MSIGNLLSSFQKINPGNFMIDYSEPNLESSNGTLSHSVVKFGSYDFQTGPSATTVNILGSTDACFRSNNVGRLKIFMRWQVTGASASVARLQFTVGANNTPLTGNFYIQQGANVANTNGIEILSKSTLNANTDILRWRWSIVEVDYTRSQIQPQDGTFAIIKAESLSDTGGVLADQRYAGAYIDPDTNQDITGLQLILSANGVPQVQRVDFGIYRINGGTLG